MDSNTQKEPICVVNGSDRTIEAGSLTQRQASWMKVGRGAQMLKGCRLTMIGDLKGRRSKI